MSPNTTPRAPSDSASAPAWAACDGGPPRGSGARSGSSAEGAREPRAGTTSAIAQSYPTRARVVGGRFAAPVGLRAGGRPDGASGLPERPVGRPWASGLRRCRGPAGPLLARLEQPLAQVRLLLRRRAPLGGIGQTLERAEPEQLQEQRRGAVQDGAELRAARLL